MNKELLQQALDALEESLDLVVKEHQSIDELYGIYPSRKAEIDALDRSVQLHKQAIIDLISAIAQPVQTNQALQAVARLLQVHEFRKPEDALKIAAAMIGVQPVQPKPVRQPLTNAEITSLAYACNALPEVVTDKTLIDFVRAIEAAIAQPVQPANEALDSARYRWLRDHENGNCVVNGELLSGEKLDRAVDNLTKESIYHLREYGDVTQKEMDEYLATGAIGNVAKSVQPVPLKPLTDAHLCVILQSIDHETKRLPPGFKQFARAVEAAHGITTPKETK